MTDTVTTSTFNQTHMTKALIFDFDGTLADTSAGIIATEQATLKAMGFPPADEEDIKKGIGLPLRGSIAVGTHLPEELLDKACDLYHSLFYEVALDKITLFDGIREALQTFHDAGFRMAIATSRNTPSLIYLLENMGIRDYFEDLANGTMVANPKPAPDMVLYLLERMKLDASEVIVIGDTTYDLMMGSGAGCRTCGVTYGNHKKELLKTAAPDYIIDDMRDLYPLIREATQSPTSEVL